jgi:hypothetical protein
LLPVVPLAPEHGHAQVSAAAVASSRSALSRSTSASIRAATSPSAASSLQQVTQTNMMKPGFAARPMPLADIQVHTLHDGVRTCMWKCRCHVLRQLLYISVYL